MTPVRNQSTSPENSPRVTQSVQPRRSRLRRRLWRGFTAPQLIVLAATTIPPAVVGGLLVARLLGLVSLEAMIGTALAAGEEPGMIIFGAMLMASPVQWLTGRSQVRVRKYLGIVFFLLALSNGAMFVLEHGWAESVSQPFLVAGVIALLIAAPLFFTSSRWAQRTLGMRRWRSLHRLTYVVAVALIGHVLLIPTIGFGELMIAAGLLFRLPPMRRLIQARGFTPRSVSRDLGVESTVVEPVDVLECGDLDPFGGSPRSFMKG